jgi:hypothetical protein
MLVASSRGRCGHEQQRELQCGGTFPLSDSQLGRPVIETRARLRFGPAPSENMVLPSIFVSEE